MEPLRALLFDLDDTLLVDEVISYEVLEIVTEEVRKLFDLKPRLFINDVIKIAAERWRYGECYLFCHTIGISSLECLWGKFLGDTAELTKLRKWAHQYRRQVFQEALENQLTKFSELASVAQRLVDQFSILRRQHQKLVSGAEKILEKLSRHYQLGLLTNGAPDLQREKIAASRCEKFFSAITISGEYGVGKPNPKIFDHLLSQLNVKAEEAMMIGNSLEKDVAGARSAGVVSVWIKLPGAIESPIVVPDFTITELKQLPKVIENFDSSLTRSRFQR